MSYTAPVGDSVYFIGSGVAYTAPYYNAVVFQWIAENTFSIQSVSTISLQAYGFSYGQFGFSGQSAASFSTDLRAFYIQTGTVTNLKNWLTVFYLDSSSSVYANPGFSFTAASSSYTAVSGFGLLESIATVISGSTSSLVAIWLKRVVASVIAKTTSFLLGAFNKDIAFVVRSKTLFGPEHMALSPGQTAIQGESALSARSQTFAPSSGSIMAGSSASFSFRASSQAYCTTQANSAMSFVSQPSLGGGFYSSAYSTPSFVGTYTYSPVIQPSPDADVVFVMTTQNKITVLH